MSMHCLSCLLSESFLTRAAGTAGDEPSVAQGWGAYQHGSRSIRIRRGPPHLNAKGRPRGGGQSCGDVHKCWSWSGALSSGKTADVATPMLTPPPPLSSGLNPPL